MRLSFTRWKRRYGYLLFLFLFLIGNMSHGQQLLGEKRVVCQRPEYFLKNTFYPKGGGTCYFQAFVDPNKQQVDKFYFNAPK